MSAPLIGLTTYREMARWGVWDQRADVLPAQYAEAVTGWITCRGLRGVILVGHSSGTHVAAEAALRRPGVVTGVVLASPVFDPTFRTLPHTLWRWALDLTREPRSLERVNRPERGRAGLRRLLHVLHEHRGYDLPAAIAALTAPVLVIRARDDALSTLPWARSLAGDAGNFAEVPGPHTFNWVHPAAWSPPIRDLASSIGAGASAGGENV